MIDWYIFHYLRTCTIVLPYIFSYLGLAPIYFHQCNIEARLRFFEDLAMFTLLVTILELSTSWQRMKTFGGHHGPRARKAGPGPVFDWGILPWSGPTTTCPHRVGPQAMCENLCTSIPEGAWEERAKQKIKNIQKCCHDKSRDRLQKKRKFYVLVSLRVYPAFWTRDLEFILH